MTGRLKAWDGTQWVYTASGGSQPGAVRLLDLGVVTAADLSGGAQVTLYTPEAGEIIVGAFYRDITLTNGPGISVCRCVMNTTSGLLTSVPFASCDNDLVYDSVNAAVNNDCPVPQTTGPVIISGTVSIGRPIPTEWVANAAHLTNDVLFENGTYWSNEGDGNSGASEPDFAGNAGGSVTDGDLTWDDSQNEPPVSGSVHVYAYVSLPATP